MRLAAFIIIIFFGVSIVTRAQDLCPHGSSEDTADALAKALQADKTCSAAADRFSQCRWGSSADTGFAPIVISKCEATFLKKLSPAGMARYGDEMQLCAYEYARQEGTMSMSEAASCQVEVAVEFAANPSIANRPAPRASFDCANTRSPIEKAICSNISLGHADIVLSKVYSGVLASFKSAEQSNLNENQKAWLKNVPTKCHISEPPYSEKSLNCIRNEFELRFTDLDSCRDGDEGLSPCLWDPKASNDMEAASDVSRSAPRASFDCESPSTALEIVICADAELGQTDIQLAQTYHQADTALGPIRHKQLVESERKWLHFVNASCPLGAIGGIPSILTRSCVRSAFQKRIVQLQECPTQNPKNPESCLNDFQLFDK